MSGIGDIARFQEEFTEEVRFEASHDGQENQETKNMSGKKTGIYKELLMLT